MSEASLLIAVPCQHGRGLAPATAHSLLYLEKPDKWAAFFPCDYHLVGARNKCVEVALQEGVDHLLFIDSDMDIPRNAYWKLLECDADIASPLMWSKHIPSFVQIFKNGKPHIGRGIEDVDESGMGCTLIRTSWLRKMDRPWFYMDGSGGEDNIFCRRSKQAGASIRCNYDVNTGHLGFVYFSGQEFTREPLNQRADRIGNRETLEMYGVLSKEVDS
jgi:hypothetical protein